MQIPWPLVSCVVAACAAVTLSACGSSDSDEPAKGATTATVREDTAAPAAKTMTACLTAGGYTLERRKSTLIRATTTSGARVAIRTFPDAGDARSFARSQKGDVIRVRRRVASLESSLSAPATTAVKRCLLLK